MRRISQVRQCAVLILVLAFILAPIPDVRGHPTAFFPGQAFCPTRTLVVGTVVMQPQQCFSIFLMRTGQGVFLGFAPAGLFFVPFGQTIGLATPLGVRMRARFLLLLPIAVPVFLVPVNTMRFEPFQVEDLGGSLGVRFVEDPSTLVPITSSSASQGPSGLPGGSSSVPLPTDLRVIPPGPEIPRDEAAFSGRWAGRWRGSGESAIDEGLPHLLVVEEITREERFLTSGRGVVGIFAWGGSSRWGVFPGWSRVRGVFERGVLNLTLPGRGRATYRMGIDGTLDATYESADFGVMRATLSR
jgi:hypothetical protein